VLRRFASGGNFAVLGEDDPGMAAAKAAAAATLPEFLRRLAAPGVNPEESAVKAAFPVPGGTEHVWIGRIRYEDGEFVGTLDNEPRADIGVQAGNIVRVQQSQVSDWKLVEHGQLVGGFTIRYFRDRMSARERAALDAALPFRIGPEPIPAAA
jgi:uncharacterized protein YegJ (DUF2314 family)